MKADNLKQTESLYSRSIVFAGLCLAVLFVTSHRAAGGGIGWTASATTYLNVYCADGSSAVSGTPDPPVSPYNPSETIYNNNGIGTPLTSYGPSSWLQDYPTAIPSPGLVNASYGPALYYDSKVTAFVDYNQSSFFLFGSNNVSSSGISPVGTSLTIANNGPNISELRLDWTAEYTYTGPPGWTPSTYYNFGDLVTDTGLGNPQYCVRAGTSGTGNPPLTWQTVPGNQTLDGGTIGGAIWACGATYVPNGFAINFSGTVGQYSAVAGQQSFQLGANPIANEVINWGGDFPNYGSLPPGLSSYLDDYFANNAGVYGFDTPNLVFNSNLYVNAPYQQCYDGSTVDIWGYIDVFVDPGVAVAKVMPSLPPELGITIQNGNPVVYIATFTGSNMTLQMCTDLTTANWTTLSNLTVTTVTVNGAQYLGFIIPNPPTPAAFFRIQP